MNNWTRAHDAWIARECERLEVMQNGPDFVVFAGWTGSYQQEPEKLYKPVYSYLTDPAAAIRAAEAWRKKAQGREVRLEWRENDVIAGLGDKQAGWHQWYEPCDRPAAALAQALYRATGGPA